VLSKGLEGLELSVGDCFFARLAVITVDNAELQWLITNVQYLMAIQQ